jgi:hypothetical protein
MPAHSGVLGTVRPWRNRDGIGLVLDKSELVGPFGGKQAFPNLVEGGSSDSHFLEVHGESLQEMGGGWENKLPGDRGNWFSGLSGGCGVGDEKNIGSDGGAEAVEGRGGADAGDGVGSSTSSTVSGSGEEAYKGCGHGKEVHEKVEGNFGGIGIVQFDVWNNKMVEQNQNQEKTKALKGSEMQRMPEAARFGGKLWCLASDDKSDVEEMDNRTAFEPALSPPIIREVA